MFINAFLGIATACGAGACTEYSGPGYGRQPISFSTPKNGVSYSSTPYTFGLGIKGVFAGRAIFDAPAGGNLLLVMPNPQPPAQGRFLWDQGDVAALRLVISALASYPDGAAFSGNLAGGIVVGTTNDNYDIVNAIGIVSGLGLAPGVNVPANPVPVINTAPLSTGVPLTIARGVLRASSVSP